MIILSKSSNWFLADESVVLIIGVVLGVPFELGVKVHVQEGLASWLILVLPRRIIRWLHRVPKVTLP